MRVFSWAFWRTLFLKSDDALARELPLARLPLPEHQLRIVAPERPTLEIPAVTPSVVDPPAERSKRPLAGQLAVQRHLRRIAKRKRNRSKVKSAAKYKTRASVPRRMSTPVNRPTSKRAAAAKRNAGKKRNTPSRHVWLSAKR